MKKPHQIKNPLDGIHPRMMNPTPYDIAKIAPYIPVKMIRKHLILAKDIEDYTWDLPIPGVYVPEVFHHFQLKHWPHGQCCLETQGVVEGYQPKMPFSLETITWQRQEFARNGPTILSPGKNWQLQKFFLVDLSLPLRTQIVAKILSVSERKEVVPPYSDFSPEIPSQRALLVHNHDTTLWDEMTLGYNTSPMGWCAGCGSALQHNGCGYCGPPRDDPFYGCLFGGAPIDKEAQSLVELWGWLFKIDPQIARDRESDLWDRDEL